ncbi:uncharacterized protein LOC128734874 isoform X1 [Sabethes cyaneus]|uniref:uncharacterized protein LOC128734874 isoform X1 n=1 Tax=Sabethes cyaneus TaxID=53552 RepID=UPI00221E286A|nr:uncharacterized protein LOC128734874 isoform X1 [Sabethes cyaneus]XP_053685234.1 uncharacterized protein LOC128734874 isoform X1 [Sabethes cyaneus]XP_053685235.1 uncharacterized protein LOC128734874 isoform X1 [Sabethes cyaneus]
MFSRHTSQFGSCASEIHKTLCYFFAAINIFLALDLLADFSEDAIDDLDRDDDDDDSDEYLFSQPMQGQWYRMSYGMLAGPALANIILAVLLVIGVYKRRPAFVRLFKWFVVAQMLVLLFALLYSYYFYINMFGRKGSIFTIWLVLVVSLALFGTEAWIAGDYYKLLLEELRIENLDSSLVI